MLSASASTASGTTPEQLGTRYRREFASLGAAAQPQGPTILRLQFANERASQVGDVLLADTIDGVHLIVTATQRADGPAGPPSIDEVGQAARRIPGVSEVWAAMNGSGLMLFTKDPAVHQHLIPLIGDGIPGLTVELAGPQAAGS